MTPIQLGLVGPIASGKGILADFLKTIGFEYVSLSDQVRQELQTRGMKITRQNLMDVGDEMRKKFGVGYWADRAMCAVKDPESNIVFDSIRNPGEINALRHLMDIRILGVDAQIERRYTRYMHRARQRGEDYPSMTAFIESSKRDMGMDQEKYGQRVDDCLKEADIIFHNDGHKHEVIAELISYLKYEFRLDPEINNRHNKEK